MRYRVTARDWDSELQLEFGIHGSVHELTDSKIVQHLLEYGRADISNCSCNEYDRYLHFHNEYDEYEDEDDEYDDA